MEKVEIKVNTVNNEDSEELVKCRTCNASSNNVKYSFLFGQWKNPWSNMQTTIANDLKSLTRINLKEDDGFSKSICEVCCMKLREACIFIKLVQDTNAAMTLTLDNVESPAWPKPILVDKTIPDAMDIKIKQEVLSDEDDDRGESWINNSVEMTDIKIEPEEMICSESLNRSDEDEDVLMGANDKDSGEESNSKYRDPATEGSSAHWVTCCTSMKKIQFVRESKLLVQAPLDPIGFYNLFFHEHYLKTIVECTNQYAETIKSSSKHRHSRILSWKLLTTEEFKVFLGLLLHSGTAKMIRMTDYWKVHRLYKSCFSLYMSRNRFNNILQCLHFTSPEEEQNSTQLMIKCQKVVDHFNSTMSNIYYPGQNLSLNESMVVWRGRLLFRQHIKGTHHNNGMRLYVLAEPDGIILNFYLFSSAENETAEMIVGKLLENKLDVGHSIYMDNLYNSYTLAKKLLDRQTYCTGMLNKTRKDNPRAINSKILKKGENISRYLNGVHIGKWKDKRDIHYISTEFADEIQEYTSRRGIKTLKPVALVHYNKNMSGVSLQDQMVSYYPCEKKSLSWYLKVFIHTMMMSLVNARLLYNKYSGEPKLSLYDFREKVIESLLPDIEPRHAQTLSKNRQQQNHKLTKLVKTRERTIKSEVVRKVQATARKDCRNCYRNKKRVQTTMECKLCPESPPMCIQCFFVLHTCDKN